MTVELKEPQATWTASEIPGLVRKKPVRKTLVPTLPVEEEKKVPPKPPVPAAVVPAPAKGEVVHSVKELVDKIEKDEAVTYQSKPVNAVEAHEELMSCLIDAQTLVAKLRAAADAYYVICDYISPDSNSQTIPVLDNIMRAIQDKNPTMLAELVESQANEIVAGWQFLQETSTRAVELCHLLTQQSRGSAIAAELTELAKTE